MARADAGLTISELAERAGVSRDTISHAEKGRHGLQAATLHKIARALGKAPSELLAEEEKLAPKVESRSSLEPSFNDVLEEERLEAIYDIALTAARRQAEQDRQAANRALASEGRPQTYFMHHENEAMPRLLQHPAGELADALIEMARRVVQLEEQLERTSETSSEQTTARSASA
jgi:transcriptional regulator with XRE-family HTH domain